MTRFFEALASPLRVALLHRLATPAFMPELAKEFGVTRQALKRHLEALEAVELVQTQRARRGALPAQQYVASPLGLFAFKEGVLGIALPPAPKLSEAAQTRLATMPSRPRAPGPGLLLVHGDAPGRWYTLAQGTNWIVGRSPRDDVSLAYDPFASTRHALVATSSQGWTITDLNSTNGTFVDFTRLPPGQARPIRAGSVITVGRSHLAFQA